MLVFYEMGAGWSSVAVKTALCFMPARCGGAPLRRFAIVVPEQTAEESLTADPADFGSGRGRRATLAGGWKRSVTQCGEHEATRYLLWPSESAITFTKLRQ
jgi:hypothetical protein